MTAPRALPGTMRAAMFRSFGGPDQMVVETVPVPRPAAGEVLLEVRAVSVNRTLDCALRAGTYSYRPELPHVPGVDASGVVVALGEGVVGPAIGHRVVTRPIVGRSPQGLPQMTGVHRWGGDAQYVRVLAANLHAIPDELDFPTATIVARHFPLAFSQVRDHARIAKGDWVLVMGAAGALGSAAVQAALYLGANVIAAAGADDRVASALAKGAHAGINYRRQALEAEVARITDGRNVDAVIENLGDPALFPRALLSLRQGGRLVTAGGHAGGVVPLDIKRLYQRQLTIIGAPVDLPEDYDLALAAAASGRLQVEIAEILPLSRVAEAHRRAEAADAIGKIILDPAR